MLIIGLTGGTGAGKTTALSVWHNLGACVIDCDTVYHELLLKSEPLCEELRSRFPEAFADRIPDRKKLGRIVFQDEKALRELNAITHKYVLMEVERQVQESEDKIIVIDAIELFSSGLYKKCDVVVGVIAPEKVRAARLSARDKVTTEYAELRISAQKNEDYFKARCEYVLENNFAEPGQFIEACKTLYHIILGRKEIMENIGKKDEIKELLLYTPKNGYKRLSNEEMERAEAYCQGYKNFLNESKTERQAVTASIRLAEQNGFLPFVPGKKYQPGDKVYMNNRGRYLILAVIGKSNLAAGSHIIAAHIDSPRLDLKPQPLFENGEMAYFKTHYYGGVRKYQWVAVPLEIHGVVVLKNGKSVDISIGNAPEDPQFIITDLLPHLATEQMKKPLADAFPGESLNLLIGSRPESGEGEDRVKLAVMKFLHEKYGIVEEDFLSAEIEVVPAFQARDIGLDRSFIGSYGHDDRVCAYASLAALFDMAPPEKTAVCIFVDKEEGGSEGIASMKSQVFETFMEDLCETQGVPLRRCFEKSFCVSADVTNGFDPGYPEVSEERNNAKMNYGMSVSKYTGKFGKGSTNDASAEIVGKLRNILDENQVIWQTAELGKVDQGGGGTVAKFVAERNIDTIDAGVPVLSMHAPYEIVSKLDCYMAYKGYKAVYES